MNYAASREEILPSISTSKVHGSKIGQQSAFTRFSSSLLSSPKEQSAFDFSSIRNIKNRIHIQERNELLKELNEMVITLEEIMIAVEKALNELVQALGQSGEHQRGHGECEIGYSSFQAAEAETGKNGETTDDPLEDELDAPLSL